MTIIVFDGEVLGADRAMTSDSNLVGHKDKIFLTDGIVAYALLGEAKCNEEVIEYLDSIYLPGKEKIENVDMLEYIKSCDFYVMAFYVSEASIKIDYFLRSLVPDRGVYPIDGVVAEGTGSDVALGSLLSGCCAKTALSVAMKVNITAGASNMSESKSSGKDKSFINLKKTLKLPCTPNYNNLYYSGK